MTIENPYDKLYTVNLVTQCLCIPIVTIFVALRFTIRTYYRQFVVVEDSKPMTVPTLYFVLTKPATCLLAWAGTLLSPR